MFSECYLLLFPLNLKYSCYSLISKNSYLRISNCFLFLFHIWNVPSFKEMIHLRIVFFLSLRFCFFGIPSFCLYILLFFKLEAFFDVWWSLATHSPLMFKSGQALCARAGGLLAFTVRDQIPSILHISQ